jgi:hypothetical protein
MPAVRTVILFGALANHHVPGNQQVDAGTRPVPTGVDWLYRYVCTSTPFFEQRFCEFLELQNVLSNAVGQTSRGYCFLRHFALQWI